jgi:hypothetical protein
VLQDTDGIGQQVPPLQENTKFRHKKQRMSRGPYSRGVSFTRGVVFILVEQGVPSLGVCVSCVCRMCMSRVHFVCVLCVCVVCACVCRVVFEIVCVSCAESCVSCVSCLVLNRVCVCVSVCACAYDPINLFGWLHPT